MEQIKLPKNPRFAVVSINAGIDRVLRLPEALEIGGMNRVKEVEICAGSKGANVALLLSHLGADVTYIAVTGGVDGEACNAFTESAGIPCKFVKTQKGVRSNIKLISPDGKATECNERGGPITKEEEKAFTEAVIKTPADVYLLCGSLPQGVSDRYYAELIRLIRFHAPKALVVLDCTGQALKEALELAPPDLIKPNRTEIAELLGAGKPHKHKEAFELCRACREKYPKTAVLCTLSREGAVYLGHKSGVALTQTTVKNPRLTVGAGDTFLGAFLAALGAGEDLPNAMRRAAATAAVHVTLGAGELPPKARILTEMQSVFAQAVE